MKGLDVGSFFFGSLFGVLAVMTFEFLSAWAELRKK